jgi:hypothetical protein
MAKEGLDVIKSRVFTFAAAAHNLARMRNLATQRSA